MRYRRTFLIAATAAAVAIGGTVVAWADWPIPGVAKVKVRGAAMPRGPQPVALKVGKRAQVSWSAVRIAPGERMLSYVIRAHSVTDAARPDVVRTVTASGRATDSVTFTAAEVAGSTWRWTVVPRFHSWAGAEGDPSQQVDFPAAKKEQADADADAPTEVAAPAKVIEKETAPAETEPAPDPGPVDAKPSPAETTDKPEQAPEPVEEESETPPAAEPPGESESPAAAE